MAAVGTRGIPGYRYGPEEDRYRGGSSSRRTWLIWTAIALLVLAVLGGVAYALLGGSGGVAMPDVTGLPVSKARAQVTEAGLVPKVVLLASATERKGIVFITNLGPDDVVPAGTTVTLTVSSGPPKVKVPDVLHQSSASARNQLRNEGFKVKQVTDQKSKAAPNTVVAQSPSPETLANKGATVTVSVSPGRRH